MIETKTLEFTQRLSKEILDDRALKSYPELIALGFWLRKANIAKILEGFQKRYGEAILLPRGKIFHIAPSNVDTIFVYSFILSMLVGNTNIVRISTRRSPQIELLLHKIDRALEATGCKELLQIVTYEHDDTLTARYSSDVDMRVIWGGDATIEHIRSIPIPAHASELTFADKFSFCALEASSVLSADMPALCEKFYRDSFTFSQMACSSIRALVWVGKSADIEAAKCHFWEHFNRYLTHKQIDIEPKQVMDKLVSESIYAASYTDITITNHLPYVSVVTLTSFAAIDEQLHCGGGLFYEIEAESLSTLLNYATHKHQTLSLFGFDKEKVRSEVQQTKPKGFDRIVALGKAMEFDHIWDGYDLMRSFCREVVIDL